MYIFDAEAISVMILWFYVYFILDCYFKLFIFC